jgi:hypothetical protein
MSMTTLISTDVIDPVFLALVNSKAPTDVVTQTTNGLMAASDKVIVDGVTGAIALKANQSDLAALTTTVGTKASQSDLTALQAAQIQALAGTGGAALVGADDGATGTLFPTVQGFVSKLMSSVGSALVGYQNEGSGAIVQTVQDTLINSTPPIYDYLPKSEWAAIEAGSSTMDLAPYIRAAYEAKRKIAWPAGYFRSSQVSFSSLVGSTIEGEGDQTVIRSVGSDPTFLFPSNTTGCRVEGVNFTSATGVARTAGSFIENNSNNFYAKKIWSTLGCYGITNTGTLVTIEDFDARDYKSGTGVAIYVNGGFNVYLSRIRGDNNVAARPAAGIYIRQTGDTTISGCNMIRYLNAFLMQPHTDEVIASVFGEDMFCDTSGTGFNVDTSLGGSIVRCAFGRVEASSHTSVGARINASAGLIDGLTIDYLETEFCATDGLALAGPNLKNLRIGKHVAGANPNGSGLTVGSGTTGWTIDQVAYGDVDGTGAPNLIGAFFNTGASGRIRSGLIKNNGTAIGGYPSGVKFGDMDGIVTRNRGTDSIASGQTSVTVNHGLSYTPSPSQISIWPLSDQASTPLFIDTTTIGPTSFQVKVPSAAASQIFFGWRGECLN